MVVVIDSGPVSAEDRLREVPQEKWRDLMVARRYFMEVRLSHDCRCLVHFVKDAERMFEALGFASLDDMIRDGYGLDPVEVDIAVKWLKLRKPDEAVPYELPLREIGIPGGKPGPGRGKKTGSNITRFKRGTKRDYTLARLHRDRPDLAQRVEAGELSANAAAIEAGFRKKPVRRCPNCHHEW